MGETVGEFRDLQKTNKCRDESLEVLLSYVTYPNSTGPLFKEKDAVVCNFEEQVSAYNNDKRGRISLYASKKSRGHMCE